MDIYKEKFTKLEKEILNYLFVNNGKSLSQRSIALALEVSPTAIANSIKKLKNTNLIKAIKDKTSQTFQIELNTENPQTIFMKRVYNLSSVYSSGLAELLFENLPGTTIILFGSYSFGEDTNNSDIDIAIIGVKEKKLNLVNFEKQLSRKIYLQFYNDFETIHKNLKESICNGIVLKGSVKL